MCVLYELLVEILKVRLICTPHLVLYGSSDQDGRGMWHNGEDDRCCIRRFGGETSGKEVI